MTCVARGWTACDRDDGSTRHRNDMISALDNNSDEEATMKSRQGMRPLQAICAATLLALAVPVAAQAYPTKPVRVVIPFGAGGSTDVLIRIVANKLPEYLGQQVVIDNRTGAGGLI